MRSSTSSQVKIPYGKDRDREGRLPYVWTPHGIARCKPLVLAGFLRKFEVGCEVNASSWDVLHTNELDEGSSLKQGVVEFSSMGPHEDSLDFYLRLPEARQIPPGYVQDGEVLKHVATGVQMLGKAIPISPRFQYKRGDTILYHYTDEHRFKLITDTMTLQATTQLSTDCDFGVGTYATKKAPHKFESHLEILYHNYPRATRQKSGDGAIVLKSLVELCNDPELNKQGQFLNRSRFCIPVQVCLEWTPAFPLTDTHGEQKGPVKEVADRYGAFDSDEHDIWIVSSLLCDDSQEPNAQFLSHSFLKDSSAARFMNLPTAISSDWDQCQIALYKAAEQGQLDIVTSCLDAGARVNALGKHGITALHAAAACGHEQVVSLLLDRCANIEASAPRRRSGRRGGRAGPTWRRLPLPERLLQQWHEDIDTKI